METKTETDTDRRLGRAMRRGLLVATAATVGVMGWLGAADHVDAPAVEQDQAADIADVYSFQSPTNRDNLVLAMTISNVQAAPEIELGRSIFDPQVLYEFNLDNDGDAVEDIVLQAYVVGSPTDQRLVLRGPATPAVTGTGSRIVDDAPQMTVPVSTGTTPEVTEANGIRLFAGVRDDPFFFDFTRFNAILAGEASGFRDPGMDTFAGLNTYSIVVEVPISRLGGDPSRLSVWGTTSR